MTLTAEIVQIGGRGCPVIFRYETVVFPWGSEHYLSTGSMMDTDALEPLSSFEAIYFGAAHGARAPDIRARSRR